MSCISSCMSTPFAETVSTMATMPTTPTTPTPSASYPTMPTFTSPSLTDNVVQLATIVDPSTSLDPTTATTPHEQEPTRATPSPSAQPTLTNQPSVPVLGSGRSWTSNTGAPPIVTHGIPKDGASGMHACPHSNCAGTDASGRQFDTDSSTPIIEYIPIAGGAQSGGVQPLNMDADNAAATVTGMSALLCTPACVNGVCTTSGVCACQWGWKDATCNVSSRNTNAP
jgi:hypothetical protein